MQQMARWSPASALRSTVDSPTLLSVTAYAYGLGVAQDSPLYSRGGTTAAV